MKVGKKISDTVQELWNKFRYYFCTPLACLPCFRRSPKIKIKYVSCSGDVAYIALPTELPRKDDAKEDGYRKTVRLRDLMDHEGADLYLDFDENNCLIGIEILV
jgi:hypothetical protein